MFLDKYAVNYGKTMVYKRRCMLMHHLDKMIIKLTRMRIFLMSLMKKNSIYPFSISILGTCWQGAAFQKNAHAHE